MKYSIPATYNFGMSYYRNFYSNRVAGGVSGAKAIRVLNKHLEYTAGTDWYTYNQEMVETPDGEDPPGVIITYEDIVFEEDGITPIDPVLCTSSLDMDEWLKEHINNDVIECKTSFICSLVKETGIMPQEDLDIFIAHKQNYVRSTERGRRIVSQYHRLGSVLERKMQQDLYRYKVYTHLYETWLKDVVQYIKDEEFTKAEETYFEAIKYLAKRYGMEDKAIDFTE